MRGPPTSLIILCDRFSLRIRCRVLSLEIPTTANSAWSKGYLALLVYLWYSPAPPRSTTVHQNSGSGSACAVTDNIPPSQPGPSFKLRRIWTVASSMQFAFMVDSAEPAAILRNLHWPRFLKGVIKASQRSSLLKGFACRILAAEQ